MQDPNIIQTATEASTSFWITITSIVTFIITMLGLYRFLLVPKFQIYTETLQNVKDEQKNIKSEQENIKATQKLLRQDIDKRKSEYELLKKELENVDERQKESISEWKDAITEIKSLIKEDNSQTRQAMEDQIKVIKELFEEKIKRVEIAKG